MKNEDFRCPDCDQIFVLKKLQKHLAEICGNKKISCPMEPEKVLKFKDIERH